MLLPRLLQDLSWINTRGEKICAVKFRWKRFQMEDYTN